MLLNDVRVHCDQITEHLKMSLRRPCKFYEKKLNHPSVLKRHLGAHSFSGDCACTGCESSYNGKATIRECLQGKHLGSKTWTSGEDVFLPPVQGKPRGEDVFLPPVQGKPKGEDVFLPPVQGKPRGEDVFLSPVQGKQKPKVWGSFKNCGRQWDHQGTLRFRCVGCDANCNMNNSLKLHVAKHQMSQVHKLSLIHI